MPEIRFPLWININVLSRIVKRFWIVPHPEVPSPFYLLPTVQPTTNFDDLLASHKILAANRNIFASGVLFTVPVGKRWRIKAFYKATSLGTTQPYVTDGANNFPMVSASQTAPILLTALDWTMEENYQIQGGSANVGDTAVNHAIIYQEEDAFRS